MSYELTPAQRARWVGFNAQLRTRGRTLANEDGDKTARVLFAILPDAEPGLRISDDHREEAKVFCLAPGPGWLRGDIIVEAGATNKWEVVKQDDNRADITVAYELVQATEKDLE